MLILIDRLYWRKMQNFETISEGLECDILSIRYDFEHVTDSFEENIFFIVWQKF